MPRSHRQAVIAPSALSFLTVQTLRVAKSAPYLDIQVNLSGTVRPPYILSATFLRTSPAPPSAWSTFPVHFAAYVVPAGIRFSMRVGERTVEAEPGDGVVLRPAHPRAPVTVVKSIPHGYAPQILEHLDSLTLVSASEDPSQLALALPLAVGSPDLTYVTPQLPHPHPGQPAAWLMA